MNENIKEQLEININEKFKQYNIDWISIEIHNTISIDVTIISETYISIVELKTFINDTLLEFNIKNNQNYQRGLVRNYSKEEAEEYCIEKPNINKNIDKFESATFKSLSNYLDNNNATNLKKEDNSNIISFYSYKGGVGRTVALIQTAYELSKLGKKVLLIDLDLEAPSFNSIFKDNINKEKGLVDYLYDKSYGIKKKPSNPSNIVDKYMFDNTFNINNILSKVSGLPNGEIFFIPAGKLGKEYVDKLDSLKEKRIYENQYIKELIEEVKEQYNIDYTFIDSRTGINNWGALSLIDICDEVFLFAYPNSENIEGTKLIYDLIKDVKNTTIVLSRIDSSIEGKNKAERLFKQFEIEQEPIYIFYDKRLALADSFPVGEVDDYHVISDFIIEIENNKKIYYILNNNKEKVKEALIDITKIDDIKFIHTLYEEKLNNENNFVVICDYNEFYNNYYNLLEESIYREIKIDDNNLYKNYINNKFENDFVVTLQFYIAEIVHKDIIHIKKENQFNKSCTVLLEFNKLYKLIEYNKIFPHDEIPYYILYVINNFNLKSDLYIKLIISPDEYKQYLFQSRLFDTNTIILSWNIINDSKNISEKVLIGEIYEYLCRILYNKIGLKITNGTIKSLSEIFADSQYFSNFYKAFSMDFSTIWFNICFSKRVIKDKYSMESKDYIYKLFMNKDYPLNSNGLLKFLKDMAKHELDDFDNKTDFTRLISLKDIK